MARFVRERFANDCELHSKLRNDRSHPIRIVRIRITWPDVRRIAVNFDCFVDRPRLFLAVEGIRKNQVQCKNGRSDD